MHFLALDLGTTHIKAAVVSARGDGRAGTLRPAAQPTGLSTIRKSSGKRQ